MRSMNMLQLLGGVAAAGVVAAGTTALTGSGVVWGGTNGGVATQFVGGTLTQTVAGASITDVAYVNDATGQQTSSIAVSLTGANGKFLQLTPSGGAYTGAIDWECTSPSIAAPVTSLTAPKVHINVGATSAVVTCVTGNAGTPGGSYDGLTTLALAVTNS
jgi:hypothetical protein